jgi:hypothetical protein
VVVVALLTITFARMSEWIAHTYANVPAAANDRVNEAPEPRMSLLVPLGNVTVWPSWPSLTHDTVPPARTVTDAGRKASSMIETRAEAGAAATATGVAPVEGVEPVVAPPVVVRPVVAPPLAVLEPGSVVGEALGAAEGSAVGCSDGSAEGAGPVGSTRGSAVDGAVVASAGASVAPMVASAVGAALADGDGAATTDARSAATGWKPHSPLVAS